MSKSTLTRRALVASTAAMPAAAALGLPVAAEPAAPDPIFAAMEQHASTGRAFLAKCTYEDALAEAGQKLTPAPGEYSRTREMVAVVNASIAAREELAATSPTTLAGLAAYLDFVVARSEDLSGEDAIFVFDGEDETLTFVRSIARSAHALARVS
jgi:ABC-type sugar transport system substrate-binding protein